MQREYNQEMSGASIQALAQVKDTVVDNDGSHVLKD